MKKQKNPNKKVIALAGNPNVGKSTVFNALTGMHQHTGNWTGKTVDSAEGRFLYKEREYVLVDLPGTYSLCSHSEEEENAGKFLQSHRYDAVIVVCDAVCLERNLNLVLQAMEITGNIIVCINLLDEAKKKGIEIDTEKLEKRLGVPTVGICARTKQGFPELLAAVQKMSADKKAPIFPVKYSESTEKAIEILCDTLRKNTNLPLNERYMSLRLLTEPKKSTEEFKEIFGDDKLKDRDISDALERAYRVCGGRKNIEDDIPESIVKTAENAVDGVVKTNQNKKHDFDRKLDKLFTSKLTGIPIMLLLLLLIFWITAVGANYPSELLQRASGFLIQKLMLLLTNAGVSVWLREMLVNGMFKVLCWVISVMLPPMAIFFPLFTLLEDFGYLPRVAFNLDHGFRKCGTCGKQALTMCMGFGCNAVGVTGCRIIDSPREKLIAVITNCLVPCNGRFPSLISIITIFFAAGSFGICRSVFTAALLTLVIVFSVLLTFVSSRILSKTLLRGVPSSFTLEMPPYRKPQVLKVIVRSIFDRTLFVLGRAAAVAAPAGIIIWLAANVTVRGESLLSAFSGALDPFAKLIGLDGVILTAFILGFPANETVVPIMIMAYTATGTLTDFDSLLGLKDILICNGWTYTTAVCFILFSLMHWPCSTTLLTIKKETHSHFWTAVSFIFPTLMGFIVCFIVKLISVIFSF